MDERRIPLLEPVTGDADISEPLDADTINQKVGAGNAARLEGIDANLGPERRELPAQRTRRHRAVRQHDGAVKRSH
jgi:hypothetical protein